MATSQNLTEFFKVFYRNRVFPREVFIKTPRVFRSKVEDWATFYDYVIGRYDVYMSVFSLEQQEQRLFDVLFLDIDSEDLSVAYMKLREVLRKLGDLDYWVFFSGSKGFHVYVGMEETYLNSYRGAMLRWVHAKGLDKLVDLSVIEARRVARVPFTRHGKTKMFMVPIKEDMSLKAIIKSALTGHSLVDIEPLGNVIPSEEVKKFDVTRVEGEEKAYTVQSVKDIFADEEMYPPCIKRILQLERAGVNLTHEQRVLLASFLLHFKTADEVVDYFRDQPDFDERTTRYQVNYIAQRRLKVMSCKNINALGLCPVKFYECPFYPSINYFLRNAGETNEEGEENGD